MRAVIPTAGIGSRLQPFTHSVPKVLLQVADKPILGHIVESLQREGVEDIAFVVGYRGAQIEEYVKKVFPNVRAHFVEQPEARGLGHAIHLTGELLADSDEPLLIILGDTVIEADLSQLKGGETSRIGVREVEDPSRFGIVEVEDGVIRGMVEKPENPKGNLAIVGVYYLTEPRALYEALAENVREERTTRGEIQLTDALQKMIERGVEMRPFPIEGWFDCGTPETLLETNRALLEEHHYDEADALCKRFPTVRIKPPVHIAPGATVADSIIGPHVTLAEGVEVADSIIKDSIISQGAVVQNGRLAHSIVGNEAKLRDHALRLYIGDKCEVVFGVSD